MGPEDVGDMRIGLGEIDQGREELAGAAAPTALGGRHTERAEPRSADQLDRLVRRLPFAVAVQRPLGDLGEQVSEPH